MIRSRAGESRPNPTPASAGGVITMNREISKRRVIAAVLLTTVLAVYPPAAGVNASDGLPDADISYRAVGARDGGTVIWFWIGSHADYDNLPKQL
jgi:hypothetical protein